MCGLIFLLTSQVNSGLEVRSTPWHFYENVIRTHHTLTCTQQYEILVQNIKNRGPDSFDLHYRSLPPWHSYSACSVLHTQGNVMTKQPVVSANESILLWNGDVFDGELVRQVHIQVSLISVKALY